MDNIIILCFVVVLCSRALCMPVDREPIELSSYAASKTSRNERHKIARRFIDTALPFGELTDKRAPNMRTKRSSDEDCEKLKLCKLHAESSRNFFAAYELYFVNKENAKLWDHHARSIAACERRFGGCYE